MTTRTPPIGISAAYVELNAQLHTTRPDYGTSGRQWASLIRALAQDIGTVNVLDYGCGKQTLAKALPELRVQGFDPAIPELSDTPGPTDLVVCTDVPEHVEPEFIDDVLDELTRITRKVALITVATRPAVKTLADGRNAHLTVQPWSWWKDRFEERFDIHALQEQHGHEFAFIARSLTFDGSLTVAFPQPKPAKPETAPTTPMGQGGQSTSTTLLQRKEVKLRFYTPNEMTRWRVQSFETKEPDTLRWLDGLAPGKVLFDIGANVGMYALYAAARGLRVYAFEPESQNFALLNANVALNQLQKQVTAFPLALSDATQVAPLYLSDFSPGGSCHSFGAEVGFDLKPRPSAFAQGSVSMPLDQMVASGALPVPDYIKIDVDGLEHKVIEGSAQTLAQSQVESVIIELNTHLGEHQTTIARLEALGLHHDPKQALGALRKQGLFEGVGEFIFQRHTPERRLFTDALQLHPPVSARARRVMHHVLDKAFATLVTDAPFPYLVVDDVFPPDYYQDILSHFPRQGDGMRPLGETGRVPAGSYKERQCVLFTDADFSRLSAEQQTFWTEFASWLYSETFASCFIQRFWTALQPRLDNILAAERTLNIKGDALLVEDRTNYAIGPHTDAPHRLITFLFYMPDDDRDKDLGTSVYTPKDPALTCWGGPHHHRKGFDLVDTVGFIPNRMLAFPKTERSFHGVESITKADVARRLLIHNVRIMGKTTH